MKIIRIISSNDKLPEDEILISLIDKTIKYLIKTGHTWFNIDLDNMMLKCSQFEKLLNNRGA